MESKENDIRLYIYSDYSVLNKAPTHIHKHRSKEAAYAAIIAIRERNKFYRSYQLVLIDYSTTTPNSRIIYIHTPGDELPTGDGLTENEISELIQTNKNQFGVQKVYRKGDIIVWEGGNPGIFRVAKDFDATEAESFFQECVITTTKTHNSIHISRVRPATEIEKIVLGSLDCLIATK